jgi:ATP-dependent DNA helicase RecG
MDPIKQIAFPFERPSYLLTPDEIYIRANQRLLNELLEDNRIERKPATIRYDQLSEYFSMWSNTEPDGGLIAIGYRNDKSLEGCLFVGQDRINEIEKCGKTHCPNARFESKRIEIVNSKNESDFVILIRVQYIESKVVKNNENRAFYRKGDSKFEYSFDEIRELEIDKGQIDFEREPCSLPYPAEFDIELINEYATKYKLNRKLSSVHTNEEILKLTHLGKIESEGFLPNNACALLFAKDPCQIFSGCKIRFLRYNGEQERTGEKWNVEKDEMIDKGSIPHLIYQAEQVLTAQLREFSRLEKDGRFYTAPEYPKEAWYEAIVNACVHRSYEQRTMNIFIKMFDDRLIIESPGGFPPLVTPENIYEMHKPRNPHLMNALFFLDLVKCANEGTKRMRDSMAEINLPDPEFSEKQLTTRLVRVTLHNNVKQRRKWIDKDASMLIGELIWEGLDETDKRIINHLAEYQPVAVNGVMRLTGLSWPTCSRRLKNLKKQGIVIDIRKPNLSRDPQCRWVLVGKKK